MLVNLERQIQNSLTFNGFSTVSNSMAKHQHCKAAPTNYVNMAKRGHFSAEAGSWYKTNMQFLVNSCRA